MIKKFITLFKIGRRLALSDALNIISKIYQIPILIRIFFSLLGLFGKKDLNKKYSEEERLCRSMESMGITFIKLGQFLATRPDIIGEKLSNQLQTLQDKVPAFTKDIALKEIKAGIGDENFNDFINISEPIAAANLPLSQILAIRIMPDEIAEKIKTDVIKIKNSLSLFTPNAEINLYKLFRLSNESGFDNIPKNGTTEARVTISAKLLMIIITSNKLSCNFLFLLNLCQSLFSSKNIFFSSKLRFDI